MAPEKNKVPDLENAPANESQSDNTVKSKLAFARFALPAALTVSILANILSVFYLRALTIGANEVAANEIPLGDYRFAAEEYEPGQVTEAKFVLHIELAPPAEKPARRLLEARRQRIRQNVEELLRTAHGGDFNDPALRELKSQLQKRINETLGIRAVSDVIVTELETERAQPPAVAGRKPDRQVPWVEPAAG